MKSKRDLIFTIVSIAIIGRLLFDDMNETSIKVHAIAGWVLVLLEDILKMIKSDET